MPVREIRTEDVARRDDLAAMRRDKLRLVQFRRRPERHLAADALDFLPAATRVEFDIPEQPPVAENDYAIDIIETIRAHPDWLFLDVGAGLRHTCYGNVVAAEIWPSASTDVVCVSEDLPFEDAQFDYVMCLAVLEHTRRPWEAVREILRVLKPGGYVLIDWPFLQPVHGYPHHYFNATPTGVASIFEADCEIVSADIKPWQHPIFTLHWVLNEWRSGLPADHIKPFEELTVGQILSLGAEQNLYLPYSQALSSERQRVIAAGTTLLARKR